jgi:hypothetical protein
MEPLPLEEHVEERVASGCHAILSERGAAPVQHLLPIEQEQQDVMRGGPINRCDNIEIIS